MQRTVGSRIYGRLNLRAAFQLGGKIHKYSGVTTSGSTDRLDLVDNDTLDASDITEWLAQAATANGHGSPYLRGDTKFDRDVDITDFNALASHFDPTGDGDPQNGPFWDEGNFDGDGDTDITDFNLLAAFFFPRWLCHVGHTRTIHRGAFAPASRLRHVPLP